MTGLRNSKDVVAGVFAGSPQLLRFLHWLLARTENLARNVAIRDSDVLGADRLFTPATLQLSYLGAVQAARARIDEAADLLRPVPLIDMRTARVGSLEDGGYEMVDDLGPDDFFLSLGVGPDVSWDQAVGPIGRGVHMYDHTVDVTPGEVPNGHHFRERICGYASDGGTTLEDCLARFPEARDHILKMDIEGSEWEVLATASSSTLARFRQIAVELHGLPDLAVRTGGDVILEALRNLSLTHAPITVHANNWASYRVVANVPLPQVLEATFVRRADYRTAAPEHRRTGSRPNDPNFPDISLSFP